MTRLLSGLGFAVALIVSSALAFDRGDLNRVLGAIFDNGNPMNDHDVSCPGCDLSGADLGNYDMGGADLAGANLANAILTGSILSNADLTSADLTGADLSNADLTDADLTGATMEGADASGARFCNTIMPDGSARSDGCGI
ncbi:MAG: pentapeptide repeat-containing protein [Alphaproteobacteria bacterium]